MKNSSLLKQNEHKKAALITTRPRLVLSNLTSLGQEITEINQFVGELTQLEQIHLGIAEIICPLLELEIKPNVAEKIQGWLKNLCDNNQVGLVVFISPSALKLLRNFFPKNWPENLRVGLMGNGSASCAIRLGIPHKQLIYPDVNLGYSQDANGFCRMLKEINNQHQLNTISHLFKNALILKGPRGKNTITQQLNDLKIVVQSLEAYHRSPVSKIEVQNILHQVYSCYKNIIFYVTSGESANHLVKVIHEDYFITFEKCKVKMFAVATHPQVAQALVECNVLNVYTIEPGRLALIDYLTNHFVK